MDPTANLEEQLRLAHGLIDAGPEIPTSALLDNADRLAELVLALDEWIRRGAFLPAAWAMAQHDGGSSRTPQATTNAAPSRTTKELGQ